MRRTLITLLVAVAASVPSTAVGATNLPAPPKSPELPLEIEAFAPYQPQFLCLSKVEPGVKAFEQLLLSTYPGTTSLGDMRPCDVGGTSEHYDGRAFDWGADHRVPAQRKAGQSLLHWLFATDAAGNEDAMFRRLGLMYVIWNKRIWGTWSHSWRPYSCSGVTDCHVNHIHFSFGWAGARERTSFWTGKVAGVLEPPLPKLAAVGASRLLKVVAATGTETAHWLAAAGATYRVTAKGTWRSPTGTADAVCRKTDDGWQPRRDGLRVDGDTIHGWGQRWEPAHDNGSGCDGSTHTYRMALETPEASTVRVELGGAGKAADSGAIRVRVVRTA
ncbi:MAG TPA: hypothetical protein VHD81_07445 [Mycobacteriales bacterium]|nr:hypothetical protein [Mycobacteriales bacterium]